MVTDPPEMVTEMFVSCWEREKWRQREMRRWGVLISFEVFAFFFKCLGVNSWMDGKKHLFYAVTV
jgi:hypothetical protein